MKTRQPPIFLDLLRIKMPVTAVTSILHRISGILIFVSLPAFISLFALSLQSATGFAAVQTFLAHPLVRVIILLLVWCLTHHVLAGIRFLLTDIDVGLGKATARLSAWWVNLGAAGITAIIAIVSCL